jgi:cytidine deaminase
MSLTTELITAAREALKKAYAPYSHYRVGAALLTKSGKIFTGCNIENASYGLTVCAERVALWKAVSSGETEFKLMAIVASSNKIPNPCGACRQVMYEFAPGIRFCLVTKSGKMVHRKLSRLLPCPFNISHGLHR